jgi:nicotinamide-nucleotide amidase
MSETEELLSSCRARGLLLCAAESCTGGLVAAELTSVAGSSDVFERGFVTYSNQAKVDMLGVNEGMLAQYGAVSREVAIAMAEGALANSRADIAVAVTGIAGPGGASTQKPIGLVHIATATRHAKRHEEFRFSDKERANIRIQSVHAAIQLLQDSCLQC